MRRIYQATYSYLLQGVRVTFKNSQVIMTDHVFSEKQKSIRNKGLHFICPIIHTSKKSLHGTIILNSSETFYWLE